MHNIIIKLTYSGSSISTKPEQQILTEPYRSALDAFKTERVCRVFVMSHRVQSTINGGTSQSGRDA